MNIDSIINFKALEIVLSDSDLPTKVEIINSIRERIHELSPFKSEPVDFVRWVINENVVSNDYYCKGLGQTQPKSEAYGKYKALKEVERLNKDLGSQ